MIRQETRGPRAEVVTTGQRTTDALGRLRKEQRDGQDPGTSFAYDRGGNLTTITDPLGRISTQAFDGFDRVMTKTLPAPATKGPMSGDVEMDWDQKRGAGGSTA